MNILITPPVHRPLVNSLSLSGVTLLKTGNYNLRYNGSKNLVISPQGTIERVTKIVKPKKRKNAKESTTTKETTSDHCKDLEPLTGRNRGSTHRRYTVKKSVVRARLLHMINQQRNSKELYFVTVTFPTCVTDDLAYKLFNTWLTTLRTSNIVKSYLWVAERQEVGTIHYHIAIPHRVYVPKANKAMVTILCNAVRKGQLQWNLQAAKRYNGVDLAKNRKTKRVTNFAVKKGSKSLANYLTKYVTKNNTEFPHLAWHCSRDFSNLITKIAFTDLECTTCGFELYLNEGKIFETEFYTFIPWSNEPPPEVLQHFADINNYILSHLN